MKRSPAPTLLLLCCTLWSSCKDKDASSTAETVLPEATVPTTPVTETERTWHGDYILRGTSLMRLLEDGKAELVLTHPGASYCETDNRSQAIWLVGDAGLSVYDLESQTLELVVAAASNTIEAFEVRFGLDQGKIGNADGLRDDVALIVIVAKRIELLSEIICEGEREALCYVDTSTDDPDLWELRPAPAALKKRYDAMRLSDTPLLQSLSERRLARPDDDVGNEDEPAGEGSEDSEGGVAVGKRMVVDGKILCGTIRRSTALAAVPDGPATAPAAVPDGPATAPAAVPDRPATAPAAVPDGPATAPAALPQ